MTEKLIRAFATQKVIVKAKRNISAGVRIHFSNPDIEDQIVYDFPLNLLAITGITVAELKRSTLPNVAKYLDFDL